MCKAQFFWVSGWVSFKIIFDRIARTQAATVALATTAKAKIGGHLRRVARMARLGFAVVFSSDQRDFVHARQMATGSVDSANTSCRIFWRAFDFKLIEVLLDVASS